MIIHEPARQTLVVDKYDVIVCGGGIAGISAALSAARQGAKVLLIEREYMLGGLATAGLIAIYLPICDGCGRQVSFSVAEELLRFSVRHGGEAEAERCYPVEWLESQDASTVKSGKYRFEVQYNPQVFAIDCENLLQENGVEILYGTVVCDTVVEQGKITHIITESKSGRQAYAVGAVIDTTGDADIVRLSGENQALFTQGNILAAWYYGVFDGKYKLRMLGFADIPDGENELEPPKLLVKRRFSGLDAQELTEQTVLAHKTALEDFLKGGKVTGSHTMATIPTVPQIRMTRRVDGVSTMSDSDSHTIFEDSVGLFADWRKKGPVYEMRFSSLYGKKIKNLICAGRNISVTDAMWDITRVIPVCAVSGQAAGTAAAICDDFANIDLAKLQAVLKKSGVVLHENEL